MTAKSNAVVPSEPTERVVLRKARTTRGENDRWEVLGTVRAASKVAAIKQLAKDEPGEYRAPSLRSWKGGLSISLPEKPKPEMRIFE